MSDRWFEERVVAPARTLCRALEVGGAADAAGHPAAQALPVEAMFRHTVPRQYAGWPREMTTDGSVAHVCLRPAEDTVVVAGATTADFGPDGFPFRAEVVLDQRGLTSITLQIGEVDPVTGIPPRLRSPILVVATGDDGVPEVELIVGRRQVPITWTTVAQIAPDDREV